MWQLLRIVLSRRETSPVTATITEVNISVSLWYPSVFQQNSILRTSLMVQGLGIYPSIQGRMNLITGPGRSHMPQGSWVHVPQRPSSCCRVCLMQLLPPTRPRAHAPQEELSSSLSHKSSSPSISGLRTIWSLGPEEHSGDHTIWVSALPWPLPSWAPRILNETRSSFYFYLFS